MQLRGYRRLFQVIDQRVKETRWRGSLSRGLLDFSWEAIKKYRMGREGDSHLPRLWKI